MEISKDDGNREEDEIGRVAPEKTNELDNLGEGEHEDELGPKGIEAVREVPVGSCPPARCQEERINGKCQGGEGCNVEGVCAPGLLSNSAVNISITRTD